MVKSAELRAMLEPDGRPNRIDGGLAEPRQPEPFHSRTQLVARQIPATFPIGKPQAAVRPPLAPPDGDKLSDIWDRVTAHDDHIGIVLHGHHVPGVRSGQGDAERK